MHCHLEALLHCGVDLAICSLVCNALHVLYGGCSVWVKDGCNTIESSNHATKSILVLNAEVDSTTCYISVLCHLLSNLFVWNCGCCTKGSICNTIAIISVDEVVSCLLQWVTHVGDLSSSLNPVVFQNLTRACKTLANHLSVILVDS